MRNRKVQREMRRKYGKEVKIDRVDSFGINDPTPYEAVKNLIRQEKKAAESRKALAVKRARASFAAREAISPV